MIKPKIRKSLFDPNYWVCYSYRLSAAGLTPALAYAEWRFWFNQ